MKHGARHKTCSHHGCDNKALRGGVCTKHGAKAKLCNHPGCTSQSRKGGVCKKHGAQRKLCSHEGCENEARREGVCKQHGAVATKKRTCSHSGCEKYAIRAGVCWSHGAKDIVKKKKSTLFDASKDVPKLPPLPDVIETDDFPTDDVSIDDIPANGMLTDDPPVDGVQEDMEDVDLGLGTQSNEISAHNEKKGRTCKKRKCADRVNANDSDNVAQGNVQHNMITAQNEEKGKACKRRKCSDAVDKKASTIVAPENDGHVSSTEEENAQDSNTQICMRADSNARQGSLIQRKHAVSGKLLCRHEGCTNVAFSRASVSKQGLCQKHGGYTKLCSQEGCSNIAHQGVISTEQRKQALQVNANTQDVQNMLKEGESALPMAPRTSVVSFQAAVAG